MAPLPTVLLPGLYATPRLFAAQLPALWREGGVHVADTTRGASWEEMAELVLAAAPPRFALCGLSMGGALALAIMRIAPERVERLALLSTTGAVDTEETRALRRGALAELRAGRVEALTAASFPALVDPLRAGDAELLAVMQAMLADTGAEAAIRQVENYMNRPDSLPGLAAIDVPTLVLVGEADRITPLARAEELATGIAGAELVVLEECGHLSALEKPDEVTAALVSWRAR
jgi:pimeloyl-ACP methyl ester carboxylesterase